MKMVIKKKLNIFMSSKAFQKCQVTDTELSRWKNCMKKKHKLLDDKLCHPTYKSFRCTSMFCDRPGQIEGHSILPWATKNSMKLNWLVTKHWRSFLALLWKSRCNLANFYFPGLFAFKTQIKKTMASKQVRVILS